MFVRPDETALSAHPLSERIVLAAHINSRAEAHGTLADWKKGVAALAAGNPLAVLAVSTAFASPLLYLARGESGGVHIWGSSSIGKTTLARLSASVWGRGDEHGALRSWSTTANAIEAVLTGVCDIGLAFDDIVQADVASFYQTIYKITGGVGKQRMRRDASLRDSYIWRLIIFSTGGYPIETKVAESGRETRAGQMVRLIDIKVEGKHGTFDDLKGKTAKALADACKHEATTHFGVAGPSFVSQLIERDITGEGIRKAVSQFMTQALAKQTNVSEQVERVAEKFGLIAVAGELAISFGIVPWAEGEARAAAARFLDQWISARGGTKPFEEEQAVRLWQQIIEAFGNSRFEDLDPPREPTDRPSSREGAREPISILPRDRLGSQKGSGENQRWMGLPQMWREECKKAGLDYLLVARTLKERGMLEGDAPKHPCQKQAWVYGKGLWMYVLTPRILEGEEG